MTKPTNKQQKEILHKLTLGAVNRASSVSLFFAISFVAYGFTSLEFLRLVDPSITLWDNLWPRLLLNGLPFLAMWWFFKDYKKQTKLKIWIWSLSFPLVFSSACLIYVWPLMIQGHPQLYLYAHAANYLVIIMSVNLVAPAPRYLFTILAGLMLSFVAPLCAIFYMLKDFVLLRFFLNEAAFGLALSGLSAYMNYSVRKKLATEDVSHKRKFEKFVGNLVSESIFENNESLVEARTSKAFLMSLDVRGFTRIAQSKGYESSNFKERYHKMVARYAGDYGGFIHKTHGDGHIISIGLVNENIDLSDVPEITLDVNQAELRRHQQQLTKCIELFEKVLSEFSLIKEDLQIDYEVAVCAGIDFGEIGLKLLGDPDVRLEFDIEGLIVIRCARLEAYTKNLRQHIASDKSYLILSTDAAKFLSPEKVFSTYDTTQEPVKDFPFENMIFFKEYTQRRHARRLAA